MLADRRWIRLLSVNIRFFFSGAGATSGTTVMASQAGQRDRGKPGIPGEVADRGAVAALGGTTRWPE
jgi:hypothetical protein